MRRRDASTKNHVAGMRTVGASDILAHLADRVPDDPNGFRVTASAARVGSALSELVKGIAATPHVKSVPEHVAAKIRGFAAINWTVGLPLSESLQSLALALLGMGITPAETTALLQWFVWGQVSVVMASVPPGVAVGYAAQVVEAADTISAKQLGMHGLSQNVVELLALRGVSATPTASPVAPAAAAVNPGGSGLNAEDNFLTRGLYGLGRTTMAISAGTNSWHDNREVSVTTKDGVSAAGIGKVESTTTTTKGPVVLPK